MAVMLPTLGEERQQTYSPFLPVSPRSGKVLLAKVVAHDVAKGTITYVEEDGSDRNRSGHRRPLQAAMEARHGHALGGAGRRLRDVRQGSSHLSAKLYDAICRIAGGTPPEQYMFELFLDDQGQKISKSKGNGISRRGMADLWPGGKPGAVHVPEAAHRQAALFRRDPQGGGRIYRLPGRLSCAGDHATNSGWKIRSGTSMAARCRTSAIRSASRCCSIWCRASNAHNRDVLWGFIRAYAPDASPEANPGLDQLVGYALRYYEDFVKPAKNYRAARRQGTRRAGRPGGAAGEAGRRARRRDGAECGL